VSNGDENRMSDRVCMVTGASSGIGKATAVGLAELGATVVLVCRNEVRGEAARAEIIESSGNEAVELMLADLASQQSTRDLARRFTASHTELHVLVNNAGIYLTKRKVSVDGVEMTLAVNYLARFLLVSLLKETLIRSAPARVIDVAGAYHKKGKINFDDLNGDAGYSGTRANAQSKLANVLFSYELARRLRSRHAAVHVPALQAIHGLGCKGCRNVDLSGVVTRSGADHRQVLHWRQGSQVLRRVSRPESCIASLGSECPARWPCRERVVGAMDKTVTQ
jgi:NAD(P)-dependent dehydrogenase (short-subunit alcohol dehydrogenase family)